MQQPVGQHMAARSGPEVKKWSDEAEVPKAHQGPGCLAKFKFLIWLCAVVLLVGLQLLADVLVREAGSTPPSPAVTPVNPEGGGGGGDSNGGNTGPLPTPPSPAPFDVPAGSQAIWWDEFDGSSLDTSKWGYDVGTGQQYSLYKWGNNESETYTNSPDNVHVADGKLYITALQAGDGYTSGRINTQASAGFYPGMTLQDGTTFSSIHLEARLQLPNPGQGLWPALWLFPMAATYGQWAASGEIDVMESTNGMTKMSQGLQFGGTAPQNQKNLVRSQQPGKVPYSDDFHVVAVDWQLGKITLSVDGNVAGTFLPQEKDPSHGWFTTAANAPPEAPFNQPFYIILNLAVGGYWPGYPDSSTPFPATFTIDYVRVWGTPV